MTTTKLLAGIVALAGCAELAPGSNDRSGAVTGYGQHVAMTHVADPNDEYAIDEDFEGPGGRGDKIFASHNTDAGVFVVVGRVDRQNVASIVRDTAYVDVFWEAASDAGAGTFHCEVARHGVYIESPDFGGQFWPNLDPSSHCTIDVDEAGAVGEPMRGSWDAVLLQKNGTELGTLHSFAGSFDVIRDADSTNPTD